MFAPNLISKFSPELLCSGDGQLLSNGQHRIRGNAIGLRNRLGVDIAKFTGDRVYRFVCSGNCECRRMNSLHPLPWEFAGLWNL